MRARPGEAIDTFYELLKVETDDCVLWPFSVQWNGYGQVGVDGRMRNVHALACEHHHGPRPERMDAAHCKPDGSPCESKRCMNGRHLAWKSRTDNVADSARHGTMARGETVGLSKLTEDDVHDIRGRVGQTQQSIADEFGISQTAVSLIRRSERWAWLPDRTADVHTLTAPDRLDEAS